MPTFLDRYGDSLHVGIYHSYIEIAACELPIPISTLIFDADQARKIGMELINLANELEGLK
jgi:hypothetical protein